MEHGHVVVHIVEAEDARAGLVGAGVAGAGHHDGDAGFIAEGERLIEITREHSEQVAVWRVVVEQREERLGFGVAEAAVELEDERIIVVDHHAAVEAALEGRAARRHFRHDRLVDRLEQRGWIGDEAGRRVDAHPAGVAAGVALADPLVVAREGQRRDDAGGDDRHRGGFLAAQPVLQHQPPGDGDQLVDRGVRLVDAGGDHNALAGREAVGLDHRQRVGAQHFDPLVGGAGGFEELGVGVGRAGRGHDLLGEPFGGLDLGGGGGGTEGADTGGVQGVDQPGGERRFGADDDKVDAALGRGADDAFDVGVGDRQVFAERGSAGVAGGTEQFGAAGTAGDRPGERVLAPAAADDQDAHGLPAPSAASVSPSGRSGRVDPAASIRLRSPCRMIGSIASISLA